MEGMEVQGDEWLVLAVLKLDCGKCRGWTWQAVVAIDNTRICGSCWHEVSRRMV